MNYSELVESGASQNERRGFLAGGDTVAITIRIPANLKKAAAEEASLRGLSFSSYVRTSLIDSLLHED